MKRQGIKYFSPEQRTQFLKTLSLRRDAARSFAMYDLMLNTGLRLAEVLALNVSDVRDKTLLEVVGKGSKVREIPLNKTIRVHLASYLKWRSETIGRYGLYSSGDALFLSRLGHRLSKRAVQRDFAKWVNVAGIEGHFTPHALRHTVGTELMNKTGNIRLVQEFLGHANISTTQIYTHITRTQVEQAAELLAS